MHYVKSLTQTEKICEVNDDTLENTFAIFFIPDSNMQEIAKDQLSKEKGLDQNESL